MLEKLLDAQNAKQNRKTKKDKIRELLEQLTGGEEDEVDKEVVDTIESITGGKAVAIPLNHDNASEMLELLAKLAKQCGSSSSDNSRALVTNIESLVSDVCDQINELRDALQSLSYTNPEGHEFIMQAKVRLGQQGTEFAFDEEKAEELGLSDWVKENLKSHEDSDD